MPAQVEAVGGYKRKAQVGQFPMSPPKRRKKKKTDIVERENDPEWLQEHIGKLEEMLMYHTRKANITQESVKSIQKQAKKQKQRYDHHYNARMKLIQRQKNLERQFNETRNSVEGLRTQNEELVVKHKKKLDKLLKEKVRILKKSGKDPRIVKRKLPEKMQGCGIVLDLVKKMQKSKIFWPPVPKKTPNYYKLIQRPMHLNKVESNLYLNKYKTIQQFREDVMLVWSNAKHYNPVFNPVHMHAKECETRFVKEMKKRYDDVGLPMARAKQVNRHPPTRQIPTQTQRAAPRKGMPRKKLSEVQMNRIESNFGLLPGEKQEEVLDIIAPFTNTKDDEDEIELDIEKLPYEAQIKLYNFCDEHFNFDTQKGGGLPDVVESPERDEKETGPAPPLEVHQPMKSPVSNPFATKVSNPFASNVPTSQVKRKLENKPSSNLWKVNTVEPKVNQSKQEYFQSFKPKPPAKSIPSQPPPLQPALPVAQKPKPFNTNKLPPIPSLVPVTKMAEAKPPIPRPAPQASKPSITPNVNLNEQRDLMNELEDLL